MEFGIQVGIWNPQSNLQDKQMSFAMSCADHYNQKTPRNTWHVSPGINATADLIDMTKIIRIVC